MSTKTKKNASADLFYGNKMEKRSLSVIRNPIFIGTFFSKHEYFSYSSITCQYQRARMPTRVQYMNNRLSTRCGSSTVKTGAFKGRPQMWRRDIKVPLQFIMNSVM